MSCSPASLRIGGTVSVMSTSAVTIALPEAQATADYRVSARFKDQAVKAWSSNHTTTTFEIQLSATVSGDVFYEVTS